VTFGVLNPEKFDVKILQICPPHLSDVDLICLLYNGCINVPCQPVTADAAAGTARIVYHIISYQKFIVRPLLREPGPWVHYKSQQNAKTPKKNKNQQVLKA